MQRLFVQHCSFQQPREQFVAGQYFFVIGCKNCWATSCWHKTVAQQDERASGKTSNIAMQLAKQQCCANAQQIRATFSSKLLKIDVAPIYHPREELVERQVLVFGWQCAMFFEHIWAKQ